VTEMRRLNIVSILSKRFFTRAVSSVILLVCCGGGVVGGTGAEVEEAGRLWEVTCA
jgi:uncharacterized membrane protein